MADLPKWSRMRAWMAFSSWPGAKSRSVSCTSRFTSLSPTWVAPRWSSSMCASSYRADVRLVVGRRPLLVVDVVGVRGANPQAARHAGVRAELAQTDRPVPPPFQASHELTQVERRRVVEFPDESGMPSLSACATHCSPRHARWTRRQGLAAAAGLRGFPAGETATRSPISGVRAPGRIALTGLSACAGQPVDAVTGSGSSRAALALLWLSGGVR